MWSPAEGDFRKEENLNLDRRRLSEVRSLTGKERRDCHEQENDKIYPA